MNDRLNIIPISMAAALHAVFIASLLVVFDFGRPVRPAVPLKIDATLVLAESLDTRPPPVSQPEPDTAAEERIAAEERKRQEDLADALHLGKSGEDQANRLAYPEIRMLFNLVTADLHVPDGNREKKFAPLRLLLQSFHGTSTEQRRL